MRSGGFFDCEGEEVSGSGENGVGVKAVDFCGPPPLPAQTARVTAPRQTCSCSGKGRGGRSPRAECGRSELWPPTGNRIWEVLIRRKDSVVHLEAARAVPKKKNTHKEERIWGNQRRPRAQGGSRREGDRGAFTAQKRHTTGAKNST